MTAEADSRLATRIEQVRERLAELWSYLKLCTLSMASLDFQLDLPYTAKRFSPTSFMSY